LECRNCSANTFSDTTNATRCEFCPPGQGQPLEGQTFCSPCQIGYANPANSDKGCQICAEGFFSETEGSSVCQRCAEGFYSDRKGAPNCTECGETRTTDALGSVSVNQCVCREGYFFTGLYRNGFNGSIGTDDLVNATLPPGTCKLCDENLYDCPGRFEPPGALDGYYMESYGIRDANDFPTVYECNPRSTCKGGPPRNCKKHRVGLACGRCESGYTRGSGGECTRCRMSGGILGFMLMSLIVMMPVGAFFYAKTSYDDPRKTRGDGTPGVSARSVISRNEREAADDPNKAFLIILSFLQHIGIISSFNLRIDVQVQELFSLPRLLMLDPTVLGVNCYGMDTFATQLMYVFSIPIIFVLAVTLVHFILEAFVFYGKKWECLDPDKVVGRRKKAWLHWFRKTFVDTAHGLGFIRILATTTQVSSFMYVALASIATTHVDCFRHPSGDFTVRLHPYVICDWNSARGKEWRDQLWLSFLAIFLYIICPYIASIVISFRMQRLTDLKKRNKATHLQDFDQVFSAAFRYVVGKYRQGMHWWECVWMARNASLALSTVIVPNIGQLQLLYYGVILTFYAFATMTFAPWRRSANSKLDIALTMLLMHIVTLIALFYTFPLPEDINADIAEVATGVLMFVYLLLTLPVLWWYGSKHLQQHHVQGGAQKGFLSGWGSRWLRPPWLGLFHSSPNLQGIKRNKDGQTGEETRPNSQTAINRNKLGNVKQLSVRTDLDYDECEDDGDDGYEASYPEQQQHSNNKQGPHHRHNHDEGRHQARLPPDSPGASSTDDEYMSLAKGVDASAGLSSIKQLRVGHRHSHPHTRSKPPDPNRGNNDDDRDDFDDRDGVESELSNKGASTIRTPANNLQIFLGFESQLRMTQGNLSGSTPAFESSVRADQT
ncbi:unnamed protein product, partial [Vitrella brassicaformis CCMP3155]